jgi:tetratricopeptide (TPR) repeat protein
LKCGQIQPRHIPTAVIALSLRPDFAKALLNRGSALQKLQRYHEALASFDQAIALRPDFAGAHYNRGISLSELKRFDEALASYDRAIALRPEYAEAYLNRGNALDVLQDNSVLLCFSEELKDFAETAALISNLDLVISVDTSVVHLAGALGKPVWVLLPNPADWRWLLGRDDSPWYPTVRLFRQDETGMWDNAITGIHAALDDFVQRYSD